MSRIKRIAKLGLTMKNKNSESCSRVFNLKTYVISKSSVGHLHTQLRTDSEKPRDQIIRSKNSLLVKLKLTHKKQVRTSYQMVLGFQTRAKIQRILTRATKVEKAFSLSFPAPGWWHSRTHSLNKYSTYKTNQLKN